MVSEVVCYVVDIKDNVANSTGLTIAQDFHFSENFREREKQICLFSLIYLKGVCVKMCHIILCPDIYKIYKKDINFSYF